MVRVVSTAAQSQISHRAAFCDIDGNRRGGERVHECTLRRAFAQITLEIRRKFQRIAIPTSIRHRILKMKLFRRLNLHCSKFNAAFQFATKMALDFSVLMSAKNITTLKITHSGKNFLKKNIRNLQENFGKILFSSGPMFRKFDKYG